MNARQFFSFYEIDALIADVPAWFHVESPRTLARALLALDFIRLGQLRATIELRLTLPRLGPILASRPLEEREKRCADD